MLSQNNINNGAPPGPKACAHCCVKITGLSVQLDRVRVLDGIDLHVHCGEVVALVGPNGAGKTTLLRAIMGEVPYQGTMEYLVGGSGRRRPRIGYVPQKLNVDLDSPISVMDLAAAAMSREPVWLGIGRERSRAVLEALRLFAADHLAKRRIGELSGGELQRVLLAMAMTSRPQLLLLDEPSTGVDSSGLALFYKLVRGLREQHDISVIIVTHDLAGISPYVDRVVALDRKVVKEPV